MGNINDASDIKENSIISIGKSASLTESTDKVTGKSVFATDVSLPHMIYGKIFRSVYPHAIIKRVDVSKASKIMGVKAVVCASDVPDGGVFASDKVYYIGQPIAAIAATDLDLASEAMELIEVEYEPLEAVFDLRESIKPNSPTLRPDRQPPPTPKPFNNICSHSHVELGDTEAGFKESDFIFEDLFNVPMAHQGYIEPHCSVADFSSDGRLLVYTGAQGQFNIRAALARILRLPVNQIKVMPAVVGGAFGGKISHLVEPVCAVLSKKSGCPVKLSLTLKEEFADSHPGPACLISLKTGSKKDGTLVSMQGEILWDTGAAPGAMTGFFARCQGIYRVKNQSFDIYSIYTNKLIPGAYRAPGATQIAFAVESQIDIIASKLGIDPIQMRLKNAVDAGDIGVDGKPYSVIGLKKCLQAIEKAIQPDRLHSKAKGWGIACGKWINGIGASAVTISLNEDGSLKLLTGAVDLTGVNTVFAQIVSEELKVPLEKVTVITGDTDTAAYVSGTGGSRTAYAMGNAIIKAVSELKTKLFQLAADRLEADIEDLKLADGKLFVKGSPEKSVTLAELGAYSIWSTKGPLLANGSLSNPSWLSNDPAFVVQAAQVEVDVETGDIKLLRFISAQDVGFALNPLLIEGQIQGACAQGIGWGLTEDYIFDSGRAVNSGYRDYRIPRAYDLPRIEAIIIEVPSAGGPYGARGVGEPAMIPAPAAIANAVYNAIGVRFKELPITADKILKLLKSEGGR